MNNYKPVKREIAVNADGYCIPERWIIHSVYSLFIHYSFRLWIMVINTISYIQSAISTITVLLTFEVMSIQEMIAAAGDLCRVYNQRHPPLRLCRRGTDILPVKCRGGFGK